MLFKKSLIFLVGINLGIVLSLVIRVVTNPEGCEECPWHVKMWKLKWYNIYNKYKITKKIRT
jgi:hypothetical protein